MSGTTAPTLTNKGNCSIVTAVCRLSHPALAFAKSIKGDPNSKAKFGASLIFEPADTMSIWQAIVMVANAKWAPVLMPDNTTVNGEGMLLKGMLHTPLRAGAERPTDAAYVGKYFINGGSDTQPQLVAADGATPLRPEAFYAGCYVRAFIGIFPFDKGVNKGIGIGLNALQFVRDGERIDGRGDAKAAFAQAGALPASATGQMPGTGYNGQPHGGKPQTAGYAAPAAPAPSWAAPTGPVLAQPAGAPQPAPGGFAPPIAAPAGPALPPGVTG